MGAMIGDLDAKYEAFVELLDSKTPEDAVKTLETFGVESQVIQQVIERHEQRVIEIRELEEPRAVVLGNRYTWYTGPRPQDKCWPALVRRLETSGWKWDPAIESLDDASTRVVSLLSHPREKLFATRGLVVGYVQSGKTTNFTAVIAKAADRGYKLVIVLAGIHNGLRRQTQKRLVQQLVEQNPTSWAQLTDLDRDFVPPANAASYFGRKNKTHVLCVIKKNATVLRKFADWLASAQDYLADCPALIIDDEADQATVATKSINPLIREILGTLPKSAYVGYTASPFANLLIDPSAEDLYPKDFIVNLPKPDGHFGTEVVFGRYALDGEAPEDVDDGYDMIRTVPKSDVAYVRPMKRVDVDSFEPVVTDALHDAINYFWLSTAARRVRGTGVPHSTMLVHTSVNTVVHQRFRAPLEKLRSGLLDALRAGAVPDELRVLWEKEIGRVPAEDFGEKTVEFDALLPELAGVVDDCRIIMDNSSSEDRLDYEGEPVVAIAVGGNTLSRGLTLEGLAVSYFVRAVSAYDTLLQMGRWFGYRDGYADLPRIWMTEELQDWFRHLSTVEAEMRRDIDVYMTEDKTPQTFAVRIRTHPSLRVTAAAKMKDAVPASSAYGGQRVQTRYFRLDADWLKRNQDAANKLVERALATGHHDSPAGDGRHVIRGVQSDDVIEFLNSYRFHEKSQECDSGLLTKYIEKRRRAGSLLQWNIAVVGNAVDPAGASNSYTFAPGLSTGRVVRARLGSAEPEATTSIDRTAADIKTLMSRRDAAIDLVGDTGKFDEEQIKKERLRQLPDTGLLVLYPIDRVSQPSPGRKSRVALNADIDVIGVGLVFPQPGVDSTVEWSSISADLSKIDIEVEDFAPLGVSAE